MSSEWSSRFDLLPKKSRPLSLGMICSKKPQVVSSIPEAPRQSLSTRMSEISSRDGYETQRRMSSVSSVKDTTASATTEARALAAGHPSEPPVMMSATFVPGGEYLGLRVGIPSLGNTISKRQENTSLASKDHKTVEKRSSASPFLPSSDDPMVTQSPNDDKVSERAGVSHEDLDHLTVRDADAISTLAGLSSDEGVTGPKTNTAKYNCEPNSEPSAPAGVRSPGRPNLAIRAARTSHCDKQQIACNDTPNIVIQSPVTPILAHSSQQPQSPRAERNLRVPYLQRLRRSRAEEYNANEVNNVPHGQQTIGSFFEDASSEGEESNSDNDSDSEHVGKGTFLGNAQQASFRRPVLVEHRRSVSTQLGLTGALNREPNPSQAGDISPLSNERLSVNDLRPHRGTQQNRVDQTTETLNWPTIEKQTPLPQPAKLSELAIENEGVRSDTGALDAVPSAQTAQRDIRDHRSFVNGLRSHPTNAKRKPPNRQVTFPLTIQAGNGKAWQAGEIVGTPYPSGYMPRSKSKQEILGDKGKTASLTIVVYGRTKGRAGITHVTVPMTVHDIPPKDIEKAEKLVANRDFDDATLSRALSKAYKSMRGIWYTTFSARSVRSVRALEYQTKCQLKTRQAKEQCDEPSEGKVRFSRTSLTDLYRNPKESKGQWKWWTWVRDLPENQDDGDESCNKVALELVEGWSFKRILSTLLLVGLLAITVTILWMFAGISTVSVQTIAQTPTKMAFSEPAETLTVTSSLYPTATAHIERSPRTAYPDIPVPTALPVVMSSASLPGVPAAGIGTPVVGVSSTGPTPTVMPQYSPSPTSSTPMTASAPSAVTMTRPEQVTSGSTGKEPPESRLGPGVALGILILLIGWMMVGAWMAVSWAVT